MPDVPTIFNRIDFIGILSPGYVAALLWILIFSPDFLAGKTPLSYDAISAVIFVIAGPALGLTLIRIHHGITSFIHNYPLLLIFEPHEDSRPANRAKAAILEREKYAKVRLELSDSERLELDMPAAFTNFEASVGVALIGIGVYGVLIPFLMNTPIIRWYILLSLIVVGSLFFVGAWLNHKVFWEPVYMRLENSLPPETTAARLENLKELLDKNLISKDDYEKKKSEIISKV